MCLRHFDMDNLPVVLLHDVSVAKSAMEAGSKQNNTPATNPGRFCQQTQRAFQTLVRSSVQQFLRKRVHTSGSRTSGWSARLYSLLLVDCIWNTDNNVERSVAILSQLH